MKHFINITYSKVLIPKALCYGGWVQIAGLSTKQSSALLYNIGMAHVLQLIDTFHLWVVISVDLQNLIYDVVGFSGGVRRCTK